MFLCAPSLAFVLDGRVSRAIHYGAHVEIAVETEELEDLRITELKWTSRHGHKQGSDFLEMKRPKSAGERIEVVCEAD